MYRLNCTLYIRLVLLGSRTNTLSRSPCLTSPILPVISVNVELYRPVTIMARSHVLLLISRMKVADRFFFIACSVNLTALHRPLASNRFYLRPFQSNRFFAHVMCANWTLQDVIDTCAQTEAVISGGKRASSGYWSDELADSGRHETNT